MFMTVLKIRLFPIFPEVLQQACRTNSHDLDVSFRDSVQRERGSTLFLEALGTTARVIQSTRLNGSTNPPKEDINTVLYKGFDEDIEWDEPSSEGEK